MTTFSFRQLAYRLSRSDILFWTLPLLMILIVVGTIAQKDLGIYAAQKTYFSSFITFIGPVPFPGGFLLIGILFLNLLMKFLLFSEWQWAKAGIILSHFGVLVLLFGGLVTVLSTDEGYMVIAQGETSHKIEDYYQRMLIIEKDGLIVYQRPHQELDKGAVIAAPDLPFTLTIDTYCFNCAIERRVGNQTDWQGPGQFMHLKPAKQVPLNEENLTGVEFTIKGSNADGKYLTFDKFPKPPVFAIAGHTYTIRIDRAGRDLPFSLTLKKFAEGFYPGSDMAKAYRSDVEVADGTSTWPVTIEMNTPLRYKGYTIYQSSFDLSGGNAFTVLNVVKNSGRLFPYIASLIVAAGLALHVLIRLRLKRNVA